MRSYLRCVVTVAFAAAVALMSVQPADAARSKKRRAPAPEKYAAFVMHADSGDVLMSKYPDSPRYPASLTKMMTLYVLFEEIEAGRLNLSSELTVSKQAAAQPPSKLGLAAGSTIDVETAIEALVVKSANDVAVVVAEAVSGSEWKFAQLMTTRARELGMRNTTFKNASGLPNSRQTTTARDLATLSQRLVYDHPQYFPYFSTREFAWNGRTYRTHNSMVRTYAGADGLKTGYTQRSGFNLATTAKRDGQRLIGVVLGGRSVRTRDSHMAEILDTAFADITANPARIATLHTTTPTPRLKPTLVAELARQRAVPTIAGNEPLRDEIRVAAAGFGPIGDTFVGLPAAPAPVAGAHKDINALIAAADSADFNEAELARLSALDTTDEIWGEGDIEETVGFAVQIGAYSTKALAQKELEAAAIAARLFDASRTVSPMPQANGGELYRARFINLSEADASAACAAIRAADLNCFVTSDAAAR